MATQEQRDFAHRLKKIQAMPGELAHSSECFEGMGDSAPLRTADDYAKIRAYRRLEQDMQRALPNIG